MTDLGLSMSDCKYFLSGISGDFWCLVVCKILTMIHLEILEYLVSKAIHQKSKTRQKLHIDYPHTISVKRYIKLEYLFLMVQVDVTPNLCSC